MSEPLTGMVEDFDVEVGLGTAAMADGRRWSFHCTQIADGSRAIDPGTAVEFHLIPGHLGRWEAGGLRPTGDPRSSTPVDPHSSTAADPAVECPDGRAG